VVLRAEGAQATLARLAEDLLGLLDVFHVPQERSQVVERVQRVRVAHAELPPPPHDGPPVEREGAVAVAGVVQEDGQVVDGPKRVRVLFAVQRLEACEHPPQKQARLLGRRPLLLQEKC